jgi:uncharacterized phage-associated protein
MSAPSSAAAVANTFLDIQEQDTSSFPRIDQMKLQKLLFYSHAWHLAQGNGPLFDEEVYAWPWGPVVPSIYGEFRDAGRQPIVGKRATELVRTGQGGFAEFRIRTPKEVPANIMQFLRSVWATHKQFSGVQLSNATHAPGEPWTVVKEQYGSLDSKPVIPNELIGSIFKAKIQQ